MVCKTENIVLFAFSHCGVEKSRVCLLFTSVKTFNDRLYMHCLKHVCTDAMEQPLGPAHLHVILLIKTAACMENFKKTCKAK